MTAERPTPEDEVIRYDCDGRESPSGYVVAYEDYAKVKRQRDELLEALQIIRDDCAEHPTFLGLDATEEEIIREGGDAASITYWHHVAADALAKATP